MTYATLTGAGLAHLTSQRLPHHTVITLHGELDLASTPDLRGRMLTALRHTKTPVIIDLSKVTFCDASGLALLIAARRRARLQGITASLAGPGPQLTKLLRITGLHRSFTVHPNLAAARHHRPAALLPEN